MATSKRSKAMQHVLDQMRSSRISQGQLGRQLDPPVTRQSVSDWHDVPEKYLSQVASLLGLKPADVRPDLAAHFENTRAKRDLCPIQP